MQNSDLRDRFATLATAPIADACVALQIDVRLGGPDILPRTRPPRLAGRALPVEHFGSVDVFFEAMSVAGPGDVLVVDNAGRRDEGCIGDLVAAESLAFGLGGLLIWGAHRDSAELREIPLPVFSTGVCPAGPRKARPRSPAALPQSVTIGETVVSRDDAVFGDEDGVIFVPLADVPRVLERAEKIATTERRQRLQIGRGVNLHSQFEWELYMSRRAADPAYTLRQHLQSLQRAIET
jgi:regulator of RNase E activity RraA